MIKKRVVSFSSTVKLVQLVIDSCGKLLQSPRLRASININLPVIRHGCLQDERSQPVSLNSNTAADGSEQKKGERDWSEWKIDRKCVRAALSQSWLSVCLCFLCFNVHFRSSYWLMQYIPLQWQPHCPAVQPSERMCVKFYITYWIEW